MMHYVIIASSILVKINCVNSEGTLILILVY